MLGCLFPSQLVERSRTCRGVASAKTEAETDARFTISDSSAFKKQRLIFYLYGSYAHLLGSAVGICYLKNANGIDDEWILSGNYEINVEGKLYPIKIHLEPPYDPKVKG